MATRRKPQPSPPADGFQWTTWTLDGIERRVEQLLVQAGKGVGRYMPGDHKRLLRDLTKQARRMRIDIRKRARKSARQFERRVGRVLTRVDPRPAKVLQATLANLKVATRTDVRQLRQRLTKLERQVAALSAKVEGDGEHPEGGRSPQGARLSA